MIKLRCVVEHITYQNLENGWSLMKVKVKDYKDLVTLTGSLQDVPVGSVLLCEGNWKVYACYGQQFVVESWQEVMPATVHGIHKSQGSEFPVVVIPVTMKHDVMLQRNLIYTGITRAKKICVLVGTTKALAYAISQPDLLQAQHQAQRAANDTPCVNFKSDK